MPDGKSEGIEGAPLAELKARLVELNDLGAAASVLSWDQAVYMPPRVRLRAAGKSPALPPSRTKKRPIPPWAVFSISSQPQRNRCLLILRWQL